MRLPAIGAVVSAVIFASSALGAPRTISVCEANRAGDQLDGTTVRITGVLRQAHPALQLFDELVDANCPEVEIHVVANIGSFPVAPPAGYKLDRRSARIAQRVAEKALADGRDLSVTIVGVRHVQTKNDSTIPPHHKWYPLLLLIESVPEIKER